MSRSAHPAGPRHGDVLPEGHYSPPPADLNALDEKVWPLTARRGEDGAVSLGGIGVRELAEEFGTPAYVLDERDFRERCRAWREAFAGADVFYAGKAFLCRAVVGWLKEEGLNLDVCTGGELAVALSAGMPPERIAMHGNNKSVAEIERAVTAGVGRIVVDSFEEIERVAVAARLSGVRQKVLVRVTVGVEAHTHEFIATAHEDQKFGLALAGGDAAEGVRRVLAHPDALELVGVHSHIGSQIFDMAGFEVSAHRVVGLLTAIRDEHGLELPEIDLGGGLGIAYTSEDDPRGPHEIAKALGEIVTRECEFAGLRVPRLSVEPGRAVVGPSAFTLYEVGTVKPLAGLRTYVSVDGGMSDNIRTALYDAAYTVGLVSRSSQAGPMAARVVGKHCESGDVVVRDAYLPADTEAGDLLAVPATGAYCRSMASNYNHVPRPPVVAVADGQARVIVRRETEEDLLRLDVG
ncbi:diaminopimelate decarboxylase [Streptomyces sp. YIM 98790]|uniref:diaminopimelate decarboxylase n=1 Tax=Streptomyces sp. YIM 98790 TaxID=2689077 RepID=UPI00140B1EAD|nr:diaminopimelate decarboxylase [Streptomyces sp. YIM 98790]